MKDILKITGIIVVGIAIVFFVSYSYNIIGTLNNKIDELEIENEWLKDQLKDFNNDSIHAKCFRIGG